MKTKKEPKVTLLGAGPGDPDLLTIAGLKALKKADVVLYDALVNPQLLKLAQGAKLIFVGKRKGYKRYQQEEINYLIVSNAYEHGHVVRLKGGDSFVFGRGGEELAYVRSFDIEAEVIPGISSALAAPSSVSIPLTQRGVAQSFWVVTGTNMQGALTDDVKLAAQSTATVVILMGMSKLPDICKLYKEQGQQSKPIAIVQNATLKKQKQVIGTIENIEDQVKHLRLTNPAVIIIGEVVGQSYKFASLVHELKHKAFNHE